ncbi:MAG: hypothetical protein JO263_03915, partial [Candidatus Eremiobacteraeota bacterium]|nr:hypothetical protein [Candidatus Eremiobacteraeota bacterium]
MLRFGPLATLVVGTLALSVRILAAQSAGSLPAITADQWRADLHYLAEQMPLRHKNLYHTMTPEAFRAAVARLDADIP